MITRTSVPVLVAVAGLLAGCAPGEEGAGAGGEEEAARQAAEPIPAEALPDTTARGVWGFLQGHNYRTWSMWPGKSALYQGTEPHGALLTTYVNVRARQAIEGEAGSMPPGAVVVKENYMPDSTLAAVTVMYKVEGYDPEHGDWYWLKLNAGDAAESEGPIAAEGRVESCRECHAAQEANDYIMTGSLAGSGGGGG